jgi:hypothetical protein
VSTKFQLFQKPANFEQRMVDCKRVLDGVKAELHVLEVKGVHAEVIQAHLDKCMVRLLGTCMSCGFSGSCYGFVYLHGHVCSWLRTGLMMEDILKN